MNTMAIHSIHSLKNPQVTWMLNDQNIFFNFNFISLINQTNRWPSRTIFKLTSPHTHIFRRRYTPNRWPSLQQFLLLHTLTALQVEQSEKEIRNTWMGMHQKSHANASRYKQLLTSRMGMHASDWCCHVRRRLSLLEDGDVRSYYSRSTSLPPRRIVPFMEIAISAGALSSSPPWMSRYSRSKQWSRSPRLSAVRDVARSRLGMDSI